MTELLLNVLAFLRKTGLVDFLRPFFEFQERMLATTVIFFIAFIVLSQRMIWCRCVGCYCCAPEGLFAVFDMFIIDESIE